MESQKPQKYRLRDSERLYSTKGEGTRITIVIPDDVGEVKRENV